MKFHLDYLDTNLCSGNDYRLGETVDGIDYHRAHILGVDPEVANILMASGDLLEALAFLLSVDDELDYPQAIEQARKAIAKAKGETK